MSEKDKEILEDAVNANANGAVEENNGAGEEQEATVLTVEE